MDSVTLMSLLLIESLFKVQVNTVSVILGLIPKRGSEKTYNYGKNGIYLKAPTPHTNLSQVKSFSSCQQAKYDRAISLKAITEMYHPTSHYISTQYTPNVISISMTFFHQLDFTLSSIHADKEQQSYAEMLLIATITNHYTFSSMIILNCT